MRFSRFSVPFGCVYFFFCALISCAQPKPSDVGGFTAEGSAVTVLALDDVSVAGSFYGDAESRLRFSFASPLTFPASGALELEYEADAVSLKSAEVAVVFEADGGPSWALPPDASFLGFSSVGKRLLRYRFPVPGKPLAAFSLSTKKITKSERPRQIEKSAPVFKLRSIRASRRAYGFDLAGDAIFLTPFVYRDMVGDAIRFTVEPTPEFRSGDSLRVKITVGSASGKLIAGSEEYRYVGRPDNTPNATLSFPAASLPENSLPFSYETKTPPRSLIAEISRFPPFPEEPIPADPGLILSYRRDYWRDSRYEVFRWERFPAILIFDTADYTVQERLFKRLAFFVEKAGFRGHLASDEDIASLHGWNAHDYRAEDLASFFEAARKSNFHLNAEETELRRILIATGLIRKVSASDESLVAGEGAIISISQESSDYLRTLFITHEGFHGIFFLDKEFRAFASDRWASLPAEPKKFLKAYFDSRRYDVRDTYLMTNELMAYCLQQPLDLVPKYFGETLPVRLEKDEWRKKSLPPRQDGELPYPTLAAEFKKIASEFDAYTASRWGVRAGRAALVYQISRTKAAR